MGLLDAALGVLAGEAEVGAPHAAGPAGLVAAGAAHGGDDEVAGADAAHRRAHLEHLAERLVAEDQVGRVRGRGAHAEGGDLPVGAAEAHVEDLHHHVAGGEDGGLAVVDEAERALLGEDGDGFHRIRSFTRVSVRRRRTLQAAPDFDKAGRAGRSPPVARRLARWDVSHRHLPGRPVDQPPRPTGAKSPLAPRARGQRGPPRAPRAALWRRGARARRRARLGSDRVRAGPACRRSRAPGGLGVPALRPRFPRCRTWGRRRCSGARRGLVVAVLQSVPDVEPAAAPDVPGRPPGPRLGLPGPNRDRPLPGPHRPSPGRRRRLLRPA